jgi:hypothetical protein
VSEGAFGAKKGHCIIFRFEDQPKADKFHTGTAVNEDDILTGVRMETRVQSTCFMSLPFVIMPTSLYTPTPNSTKRNKFEWKCMPWIK